MRLPTFYELNLIPNWGMLFQLQTLSVLASTLLVLRLRMTSNLFLKSLPSIAKRTTYGTNLML